MSNVVRFLCLPVIKNPKTFKGLFLSLSNELLRAFVTKQSRKYLKIYSETFKQISINALDRQY